MPSTRSLPTRLIDRLIRIAPSALGVGPPAIDGNADPSGPRVVQAGIAGCGVVVHGVMYAATGSPSFLWVAGLTLVYLVVGIPATIRMAETSSTLATWGDLVTMIAMATVMGDPITLVAWFPLIVIANLIYVGSLDGVRNALAMASVAGGYFLGMLLVSDRLFDIETTRLYLGVTLVIWMGASTVYSLAIGGAVHRKNQAVADAIAQRDLHELRARHEAERMRAFLEEAPIGILVQGEDERFEYANAPALEMLNLSLEELRAGGAAAAMDPAARELVENEIRTASDKRKPFQVEFQTIHGRILELRGRHVELDEGFTTVTTLRDLTPQRQAHQHIARLRTLVETSETHMVVWDDSGEIVIANRAFRALWAGGDQVVERSIVDVIGEQIRPIVDMPRLESEQTFERVAVVPSGETAWVSISVADFQDPLDGRWLRAVSARDVTAIAQARRQLEELVANKDQFIASVSHELRTPLTVVVGLASELAHDPTALSESEIVEFSTLIASQANEVASLVEDLLTIGRADAGVLSIDPERVDLSVAVANVLSGLPADLRARVSVAETPRSFVHADPVRVRQIIRNLITNAGRYGGQAIEVEVMAGVVEVRDNGDPVPPTERERMFEAYERVHARPGTPESVGLGLTVCRRLSRLMSGDVVYDHDGRWSVFRLTLPEGPGSLSDSIPSSL